MAAELFISSFFCCQYVRFVVAATIISLNVELSGFSSCWLSCDSIVGDISHLSVGRFENESQIPNSVYSTHIRNTTECVVLCLLTTVAGKDKTNPTQLKK